MEPTVWAFKSFHMFSLISDLDHSSSPVLGISCTNTTGQCCTNEVWCPRQSLQRQPTLTPWTDPGAYASMLAWECTQYQEPPFPHPFLPSLPQRSRSQLRPMSCPGWAAPVGARFLWHLGYSAHLPCTCYGTATGRAQVCVGFSKWARIQ